MENQLVNMTEKKSASVADRQFLTFELAGSMYAVEILAVKEIIGYGAITRIPMVHDTMHGVINLRGNVVPVIDLAIRFDKNREEITRFTCIIVVEIDYDDALQDIGIVVDAVDEVINIPLADIEPPPSFGSSIPPHYIGGVGKVNGQFIMLLNMHRVLDIAELASLEYTPGKRMRRVRSEALLADDALKSGQALPAPQPEAGKS